MTSQHDKPKRRQFGLKTVFLIVLAICIGLVWWFRPFIIEDDPLYKDEPPITTAVRRSWDGRLRHWGAMTRYYRNGQKAAEIVLYGNEVDPDGYPIGEPGTRYWHQDGRELSWREWTCYQSFEYVARYVGDGESAATEAEWRAHLRERKDDYDRIEAEYEEAMAALKKDE
jgi:hypothetical protein